MISSNVTPVRAQARRIVHRTLGNTHGPITRLMSPGDLGELVKPFVFLDYFEMEKFRAPGMPDHPHSGIATHTTLLEGSVDYWDSTGKSGQLWPGSVEWMQAGGGVWHGGKPHPGGKIRGYQLWVALPAGLELQPARSQYIDASAIETDGRVRVLLGRHEQLRSPIAEVSPIHYLHVRLQDGETWHYQPPTGHDVVWVAVNEGKLHAAGDLLRRAAAPQMGIFEEGHGALELRAEGETEFVLGSATKHPYPLICGSYSVHTSVSALIDGEKGIRRVAAALQSAR
ncbi:pirin family protein [Pendulispora brunnea]|uniref:Pirin family protein n=1 Tax=Pendulispora brunnea TaxID=2905690 RepID=A0ABZ2K7S4_9BACT